MKFPVALARIVLLSIILFSSHASAQICVLPPGLVAWWPGDEHTTDIAGGHTATLMNDIWEMLECSGKR